MKKKISLIDIKVDSFLTSAEDIKGGAVTDPSLYTLCEDSCIDIIETDY